MKEKRVNLDFSSEGKGKMTFFRVSEFVVCIGILILVLYIFLIPAIYGKDTQVSADEVTEVEGWYYYDSAGKKVSADLPVLIESNDTGVIILETVLPAEISEKDYLTTRLLRCTVRAYVDDKLRVDWTERNDRIFRSEDYSKYIFIPLTPEDAGKVIRLELHKRVIKDFAVVPFYLGEKSSETMLYRNSRIPDIIFGFALLVIGCCCTLYGFVIKIKLKDRVFIDYLGWSLFLIALWDLTQTEFRDFYFANIEAISLIPALCLMGFPMALALYFNALQENRFSKLYGGFLIISGGNLILSLVLHFTRIRDLYASFGFVFALLAILIAIVMFTIVLDYKAGLAQKYPFVVVGAVLLSFCGVAQMLMFILDPFYSQSLGLTIGTFLFVVFAVIHAINNILVLDMDKKTALRTAELKSRFLASMSHEIRTPITAVLGMNQMIIRESSEEQIKGYASEVDTAGRMLLSLINDILDFSKLESGNMPIVPLEYEVRPVILSSYKMLARRAKERGLEYEIKVDPDIPARLYGDSRRISQIFVNLLTNAVKYTEHGRVLFEVGAEEITPEKVVLVCSVTDTGKGIKEEDIDKLFSAFLRLSENVNSSIEGTGLGLTITKTLLELMDGEILVESEYGKGSKFTVRIPQKVVNAKPIGTFDEENVSRESKKEFSDLFLTENVRILAVDDVSVNLKVVSSFLKNTGIVVDTAGSGDECLELVKKEKYDLILLDHMMPGKDGVQTFHEIKELRDNPNTDIPIIMLTANAIMGAREQFLEEGFDDFISKPFSIWNMQRVIRQYIPREKFIFDNGEES